MVDWLGTWRNQYGSTVSITSVEGDRIEGTFDTALEESGFYGRSIPIVGLTRGNCIAFSSVGSGATGDMVVSYTGLFRDGRMETMWFYAADEASVSPAAGAPAERRSVPWWKAVTINADTFERVDSGGRT